MTNSFLTFLGHGGFKLLIIAAFVIANFAKARAKERKKSDALLRGSTEISYFSSPQQPPVPTPQANPTPLSKTLSALKPNNSASGSPWSSNQNPFDS